MTCRQSSHLPRQIGDCHSLNCFNEWYPQANNITLSKYAFELLEIFDHGKVKARYPDWEMGLFGHSPDTVSFLPQSASGRELTQIGQRVGLLPCSMG